MCNTLFAFTTVFDLFKAFICGLESIYETLKTITKFEREPKKAVSPSSINSQLVKVQVHGL